MRLIDKDKLYQKATDILQDQAGWKEFAIANAISMAETIEAEPVRYGKWEFAGDGIVGCTSCGEIYRSRYVIPRNYCPNCGAKMDGGTDNG